MKSGEESLKDRPTLRTIERSHFFYKTDLKIEFQRGPKNANLGTHAHRLTNTASNRGKINFPKRLDKELRLFTYILHPFFLCLPFVFFLFPFLVPSARTKRGERDFSLMKTNTHTMGEEKNWKKCRLRVEHGKVERNSCMWGFRASMSLIKRQRWALFSVGPFYLPQPQGRCGGVWIAFQIFAQPNEPRASVRRDNELQMPSEFDFCPICHLNAAECDDSVKTAGMTPCSAHLPPR